MSNVLVPLAQGFEEIEAITVIDILRRAGVNVTVAGLRPGPVEGRSRIQVLADVSLNDVKSADFDMLVLPGGLPGATHLKEDPRVQGIIRDLAARGKFTAAICAAPTVLSAMGMLKGRRATSHPSVQKDLGETNYLEDRVVVDGSIITSRSPGTAMEFALKLVEILCGKEKREEVGRSVLAAVGSR
jgi:4-methyl-5(b-hydroxyethyl)-thiazole monophosphate biosynthesis